MGGDRPALELFPALIEICKLYNYEHTLVAFVQHSLVSDLQAIVDQLLPEGKRGIELVTASSYITMEESPLLAVRRKKDSSMGAAMRLLANKELDALISVGNTGALVATAMLYLPMLPGVERAALMVLLPSAQKDVIVLDVGANIEPKSEHLLSYARMAMAYYRVFVSIGDEPKIGLLNVGVEELKGTAWHKRAYQLLEEELGECFIGNVEGREVFEGKIDILITDGFSGNVFLKTCEGVASFLTYYLSNKMFTFAGARNSSLVSHLHKQFNYSQRPGALLCGVEGLVIKCHGHSSVPAIVSGIKGAIALVEAEVISRMKNQLSK